MGKEKFAFIDFEFKLSCIKPKLICAVLRVTKTQSTKEKRYWLQNNSFSDLISDLELLKKHQYTLVSFTDAEAKCFYSLGLNPLEFKWLDCQIIGLPFFHSSKEFSVFSRANSVPQTGQDFEGIDPYEATKIADATVRKKSASLLGFHKFFCGKKRHIDLQEQKDKVRDLIINSKENHVFTSNEAESILEYCSSDVVVLQELLYGQIEKIKKITGKKFDEVIAQYHSLSMHRIRMCDVSFGGIPLNKVLYEDLCKNYEHRIEEEKKEQSLFYRKQEKILYTKDCAGGKKGDVRVPEKYVLDDSKLKDFVTSRGLQDIWPKTPNSGKYRMDDETLDNFSSYKEVFDFHQSKKRIKHIEFFQKDDEGIPKISRSVTFQDGIYWQHPEFGAVGTITGRNAHRTSTFIMGMERNFRKELLGCPEGFVILQPDFSSQEVWIAGALSQDPNQLKSANTDPYLDYGRICGLIPPEGDKYSHSFERDICKQLVLGPFYGMGVKNQAIRVKKPFEEVKILARKNKAYYKTFFNWRSKFIKEHQEKKYCELPNGVCLLDNVDCFGSYKICTSMNFPIQGMGAGIMMKVVELFYEKIKSPTTRIIYTLHDELGVICKQEDKEKCSSKLVEIMQEACLFFFPNNNPPRISFK